MTARASFQSFRASSSIVDVARASASFVVDARTRARRRRAHRVVARVIVGVVARVARGVGIVVGIAATRREMERCRRLVSARRVSFFGLLTSARVGRRDKCGWINV
jgi:hypothetical protein